MHGSRGPRALLLPLLLLASAGAAGALLEEERRALLLLHNLYRARVSPPAADMLRLSWDERLAAFAAAYAHKCVWGHNAERGRRGENLFAITDEGLDVPLAVGEWFGERLHYNLSAAACAPGQVCGHYTQLAWSGTERIGCGSQFCEKLQGVEESNVHLLVCNYEPPGNVKGRRPYREGTPCSQCPPGYRCNDSLCEPAEGPEEAQEEAQDPPLPPSGAGAAGSGGALTTPLATGPLSLATEGLGALATAAPSSLAAQPSSPASASAGPALAGGAPSVLGTHQPLSGDGGPLPLPRSTHLPAPEYAARADSRTRATPESPEGALDPKMAPAGTRGTRGPLPSAQAGTRAGGGAPAPREAPASVSPAAQSSEEPLAPRALPGPSCRPPADPPTAASARAPGGRVLALQALPGAEGPALGSGVKARGPAWGPPLGLLLPPLLLAATL